MTDTPRVFSPSAEQSAFLEWVRTGSGSCVLEAVAGAGKTTTLVEGVKLMKGHVFLGAFNKKMADELKSRVGGMQGKKTGTFHSVGFSALCYANPDLRSDKDAVDDKKVRRIVEKMLEGTSEEGVDGLESAVCHLVSLGKQTGFHIERLVPHVQFRFWEELVVRHDVEDRLPEDFSRQRLVRIADEALHRSNDDRSTVDFDDMIYLPLLLKLRFFQNDWVLVDEAQDTNAVRREMARLMLKPRTGRLVAVGDPHQAIYGFTGADNESLDMIRETFGATRMQLSVSWRCPTEVVRVARQYVDHIRPAPGAPAGEILTSTYTKMVASVSPGQAVLCRFNAPLVDLCFRLIREGKPAKIEGRSIGEGLSALIGRWKVKNIDALETKLQGWHEKERGRIEAAKGTDKSWEVKLGRLEDKYDTIVVLIERARELKMTKVSELQDMVKDMFADVGASPSLVVLSSVHKSKGLEWPVVHILGRGDIMPSQRAHQPWQQEQEINLCYVAVTRAQRILVDVAMPTPEELRRKVAVEEKKPEGEEVKS